MEAPARATDRRNDSVFARHNNRLIGRSTNLAGAVIHRAMAAAGFMIQSQVSGEPIGVVHEWVDKETAGRPTCDGPSPGRAVVDDRAG
jgi:hypothetical protein